jgi:hypothetical protein
MQTIDRFEIGLGTNTPVGVFMPKNAVVLHVDWDDSSERFSVWAIIETSEVNSEKRTFLISSTRKDLNNGLKGDELLEHHGSFNVPAPGRNAWFHAFEVHKEVDGKDAE